MPSYRGPSVGKPVFQSAASVSYSRSVGTDAGGRTTRKVVADFSTTVCFCVRGSQCSTCAKAGFCADYVQRATINSRLLSEIKVLIRLLVLQSCPISQQGHTIKGGNKRAVATPSASAARKYQHAWPTIANSKSTPEAAPCRCL